MEGISDIKIIGFDDNRPPLIQKEPYIDLFFKLSHQAPKEWCDDFNQLISKNKYNAKITPATGLFVDAWVRKPEEIKDLLEELKKNIDTCTEDYIDNINAAIRAASDSNSNSKSSDDGEQGKLNRIVAALDYD